MYNYLAIQKQKGINLLKYSLESFILDAFFMERKTNFIQKYV